MGNNFELESKLLITDVRTVNALFLEEDGSDAVALYFFYYKTAKKQFTLQIRATDNYCQKGLHWGEKRFRTAKAILKKFNLVENVKSGDDWYISIKYIKSTTPQSHGVDSSPTTPQKEVLPFRGQMLNNNNKYRNAYTLTNVRDESSKNSTSCPLKNLSNPLNAKYPKGHAECVEYVTSFKFVNKGKQFKFLHQMLRAGLDFPDVDRIIARVEKKPYFQENGYDLATIAGEADRRSNAIKTNSN